MNSQSAGPQLSVPPPQAEMAQRFHNKDLHQAESGSQLKQDGESHKSNNPEQPVQNPKPAQDPKPSQEQRPSQEPKPSREQEPSQDYDDRLEGLPSYLKPSPEEVLYEWTSNERAFKPRRKQQFATISSIVALLSLILFFANQFLPIGVVIALGFLWYVYATTPPTLVKHQLSTYGYRIEDRLYYWEEMGRFWFTEKYGERILHAEVSRFPFHLTMLVGDASEKSLRLIMSNVLLEGEPEKTFVEKAGQWLQEKIPIDVDA